MILFFYCHPDISNFLIDSMTESPQNDYDIDWNRRLEVAGTNPEPMLVGKRSRSRQEHGSFCL